MSFGSRAVGVPSLASRGESDSAPVAEGDVLAGKYKVERVLGVGGMGVVVAARHLQLDQLVALKFVLPSALEDRLVTERFLREAKAAAKLKSEHVAKVLDVGTLETNAPYIVMEYLEGTNLAEVIALQAPLAPDVACDYLIQACEALSEAHTLGIVHRDLKPQNLFLTKGIGGGALVKVLDFGISKIKETETAHHLTQTTTVIGSPLYMAPEQMRSARNADPRSDIWSLGVVLYELLVRQLPFEAETITDLAIKIVQEPFPLLENLRPEISPALAAVVYKCLEKDPANRFTDAGELASALEPFAPPSSRLVADRARKVVSAHSKTLGYAVSPILAAASASRIPTAMSGAPAPAKPTKNSSSMPEVWSETKGGGGQKTKTWAVAATAAAVTLVLAFIGFRAFGRPEAPAPPVSASSVVAVPPEATQAPSPPAARPQAASATATPPAVSVSGSASAVAPAAPATVATNAPRGASVPPSHSPSPAPPPPPRPTKPRAPQGAPARPDPGNDDIPSLR
jgi:serine/threonine protein kinase